VPAGKRTGRPLPGARGRRGLVLVRATRAVAPLAVAALLVMGPAAPAGAAYEEIEVKDGGAVAGRVTFAGTPPKLEPLAVNKNRDVCGDRKPNEALVVGPDGGVRGSVLLLEGLTRGKRPGGEVVLDNAKCLFVSHVSATMVGGRVRVRNSDAILHNTHGFLGRPTVFNLALPNKDQVIDITRRLTRPGVVRVLCDAHPHMFAWLVVHDSPYFAVTDDRGAFRIEGVPPGSYRLTMWHEGFRPRGVDRDGRPLYEDPVIITRDVTIPPRGTAAVDFELR
jgi:hypothetical protein